jgi:ATP-dependent protease HslVU (ClpYQ) peptidase subunit
LAARAKIAAREAAKAQKAADIHAFVEGLHKQYEREGRKLLAAAVEEDRAWERDKRNRG